MSRTKKNALAVLAAALGIPGIAAASGFQLIEQNASGLGNAYAGQAAAAENASTVFFNPAGMTALPGRQVSGVLHLIGPSMKFEDNGGTRSPTNAPLPAAGTNGGDAGGWIPTGNAYASWQLSPRLWSGLGISAPFGLKTDYDAAFAGRFQSRLAEFKTLDVNPSFAYKVSDAFSIGGGLSYQHAEFTLNRSFFAGTELPQSVKLSDSAWGWNAGVLVNWSPQTRIGMSYRSSMSHELTGAVSVTGLGAAGGKASVKLPDTLSWAIAHQLDQKWQMLGDVTYTRWSEIKGVPLVLTSAGLGASPAGTVADTLDFQFRDAYRVGLGVNYKWKPDTTLKLGVAYDRSPVPDAAHRTVSLPDSDRRWLAFGAKYQLSRAATLDAGYAHVFMSDGGVLHNKRVGVAGAQGIVSGSYKSNVDIVSVQFTYAF